MLISLIITGPKTVELFLLDTYDIAVTIHVYYILNIVVD